MMIWPFVGRDDELRRIVEWASRGESVIVVGAAGVGKSRLVAEALASRSGAAGAAVAGAAVAVRATAAAQGTPFGAFAHLLPAEPPRAGNPLGWAVRAVVSRAGPRTVLPVDDAHLLDPASAALLHQLVFARGVTAIVTARTGVTHPDALTSLWKDGLAHRVDLSPLPAAALAALLAAALAAPIEAATRERLCAAADGNPLLLRELVTAWVDAGSLRVEGGRWVATGELAWSPRLEELVDGRIAALDGPTSRLMELVAFGEPLPLATLERVSDRTTMESAEDTGLIQLRATPTGTECRMAHPLYAEAIRRRVGVLHRRRIQAELADLVAASGAPGYEVVRVARWRVDSGTATDPELLLRAARATWAASDHPLSERLCRAALELGAGVEATLLLAAGLNYTGRFAEAAALLAGTAVPDDPQMRKELVLARGFTVGLGLGRPDEADALLAVASRTFDSREAVQDIAVLRGAVRMWQGRLAAAEARSAEVLAEPASEALRAQALLVRARAALHAGQPERAVADACSALSTRSSWQEVAPLAPMWLALTTAEARVLLADLDGLSAAMDDAERTEVPLAVTLVPWQRGIEALHRGQITAAVAQLRAACANEAPMFDPARHAALAQAYALCGDVDAARAAIATAEARLASSPLTNIALDLVRPWVVAATGELSTAAAHAQRVAESYDDTELMEPAMRAWHHAVVLGAGPVAAQRLADVAVLQEGEYAAICAAEARATDGSALDNVAARWRRHDFRIFAIDAAARAAQAHRSAGRADLARASTAVAWAVARECDGLRSWSTHRIQAPDLTSRELEIALLAADGLTSKQIAAQLVVSDRTVNNHLQTIYGKLGINSRTRLADILGRTPQPDPH
jgi:DNA-binding CsgD family transcriptional regulator